MTKGWERLWGRSVESSRKVADTTKDERCDATGWNLWDNLGKEISCGAVEVIVHLLQEYWSFIWEHKDHTLNCVESKSHADVEQSSPSVLVVFIDKRLSLWNCDSELEAEDNEDGCNNSWEASDDKCLR